METITIIALVLAFILAGAGVYFFSKWLNSMHGSTPMSRLKMTGIVGVVLFVIVYAGFIFLFPHTSNNYNGEYVSGQVISGNGYVSIETLPIDNAQAMSVVTPVPTVAPTVEPVLTPTPVPTTLAPDGNIYYGNIVYVEKPTATVKPIVGENSKYLNEFNYYKCNGLNLQYDLSENKKVKANSQYTFTVKLTNVKKGQIKHVVSTMTGSSLNDDPLLNVALGSPQQIYNEYVTVDNQDSLTISKTVSIPNYKGHFKLYVTINCDNGANAEIMQEVTIT